MSDLRKEGLKLYGGCYCSAVRYWINIPPLAERPILLPAEKNNGNGDVRLPMISFDHCNDCRRAGANVVPTWIKVPQTWVKWSVPVSKVPLPVPTGNIEGRAIKGGERIDVKTEEFVQRPPELEGFVSYFNSSPDTWRTFCTRCGTNLSYVCLTMRGAGAIPMIDVTLGSLDRESIDQPGIRPTRHFYWDYGVDWVQKVVTNGDTALENKPLPRHPEFNRHETV